MITHLTTEFRAIFQFCHSYLRNAAVVKTNIVNMFVNAVLSSLKDELRYLYLTNNYFS